MDRHSSEVPGGCPALVSIVVLTLMFAAFAVAPRASGLDFIEDLGTLPPDEWSEAPAINEEGQIVGQSNDGDGRRVRAFLWENGTMTQLGGLGGRYTMAYDINEAGQIVGGGTNASEGRGRALLWEGGVLIDLGFEGGASAINDPGQIAGMMYTPSGYTHAVFWEAGETTDLGTLGGDYSWASGINNQGQVVGYSTLTPGNWDPHGFLWQDGTMTDLGALGGDDYSQAWDINEAGQIVGLSYTSSGGRAFLWEDGVMTDLGSLEGGHSEARGINDAGQIVGWSVDSKSNRYAVLWEHGTIRNLGALPNGESRGEDINEGGRVVGSSSRDYRYWHAVLWNLTLGPVHDIAATNAYANPQSVVVGDPVWIGGAVTNEGTEQESVDVSIYAGSILVGTRTVTDLVPGASVWVEFTWNTSGIGPGSYPLIVEAAPVADESDLADNTFAGPTIEVHPPIEAIVAARPAQTDVTMLITFTCENRDWGPPFGPYSFSWTFDDGATASGREVIHSFDTPGDHVATCTVTEDSGTSGTASVTVPVFPLPSVTASVDRANADPGETLTFTATTEGGSGGFTYNWGFGDGTSAEGAQVTHSYANQGQFTAIVTVRDSAGGTAANTVTVKIGGGASAPLQVVAAGTAYVTDVGLAVSFTCLAAEGTPPYQFEWAFGDGATAQSATATHAYEEPGTKTATCTVTDDAAATAAARLNIEVYPVPAVSASADRVSVSPGTPITFTAVASGGSGGFTHSWGFGDGNSSQGAIVTHTYENPGQYAVIVTVQDLAGGTASNTVALTITVSHVTAMAIPSTTSSRANEPITFSAVATGGAGSPYTFSWNFGDGTTKEGATVTHAYASEGSYTPKLTVTDAAGASRETVLGPITVEGPVTNPAVQATPFGSTEFLLGAGVGFGVAAALLVALLRRKRPGA